MQDISRNFVWAKCTDLGDQVFLKLGQGCFMENGSITLENFNSALKQIYKVIIASYPEDNWEIQAVDESPSLELVCIHFCTVSNITARVEYRISYSDSYAVPILMFRGSFKDGRPLPISYFWDSFSKKSLGNLDLFSVISQTEHKFTGVPYFFIHPCRTVNLMSDVSPTSPKGYLSFWLSLMASYFKIYVPPSIATD